MGKVAEFCRHSGDINGCKLSLVKSWQEGTLEKHCIFEGLRANLYQCRQVLHEGFYDPKAESKVASMARSATIRVSKSDFEEACKEVSLIGFPEGIEALWDVFYEAYYKIVQSAIHRFGIRDDEEPSAYDVFQGVFKNLLDHFQKRRTVKNQLSTYVRSVTIHECYKVIRCALKRRTSTYEDDLREAKASVAVFAPPRVVEHWEDLDDRLLKSDQGDVINRIILAMQCLEACSSGSRPSARQLKLWWELSSKFTEEKITLLHKKATVEVERFGSFGAVNVVAGLANSGVIADRPDLPVVFASATGMNPEQIRQLLNKLNSLSEGAIHTRICRMYMVLQPPKKGK